MQTWMYLAVPVLLYVGERLIRAFRSSIKPVQILKVSIFPLLLFFFWISLFCESNIEYKLNASISDWNLKVAVYPGNVLALHMSRPQGFKYKSGQYMFVNCAAVSPFEW